MPDRIIEIICDGEDVKKFVCDDETVWCKPFVYSTGALPTGVASLTCTRQSTQEPTASTGTVSSGSYVFWNDALYWTATASTGYRISGITYGSASSLYTVSGVTTGASASGVSVARISGTISQGTLPTGVASITCYRKAWDGSSFSQYTGSTVYYGDQFYWTASPSTGYNDPSLTYYDASHAYTWTGSQGGSITSVSASGLVAGGKTPYTITWKYLSAYPDTWATTTETYYYNDTPSRSAASTVAFGTYRKLFSSWDSLAKVTGSRTITAQYTTEYYITCNGTRCSSTSSRWGAQGTVFTATWTADDDCSFGGTTEQDTTTQSITIGTAPATYSKTAGYIYVTIQYGSNNSGASLPSGRMCIEYNSSCTWYSATNYSYTPGSVKTNKTVNLTTPGGTYSYSPSNIKAGSITANYCAADRDASTYYPSGTQITWTADANHSFAGSVTGDVRGGKTTITAGGAFSMTPGYTKCSISGTNCIFSPTSSPQILQNGNDGMTPAATIIWMALTGYHFGSDRSVTTDTATVSAATTNYEKTANINVYTIAFTRKSQSANGIQSLGTAIDDTSIGVASVSVEYGGSYSKTFSKTNYVSQTKSGSNVTADATVAVTLTPVTYSLTWSGSNWSGGWYANSSYTGSAITWMYHGYTAYFRATPDGRKGATHSSTWYYNGKYYTTTASNANGSVSLTAASAITYAVSGGTAGHGTVSWTNGTYGANSTWTIAANTGYTRPSAYTGTKAINTDNFTVSDANKTAVYSGSLGDCTANKYTLTINRNYYAITGAQSKASSATADSAASIEVTYDASYSYTYSKTGYDSQTASGTWTTAGNGSTTLILNPHQYTVSQTAISNASESVNYSWVYYNQSAEQTVTPDTGYDYTASSVRYYNGNSYKRPSGAITANYTFGALTMNKFDYTVSGGSSSNGSVAWTGSKKIGGSATWTITANTGYSRPTNYTGNVTINSTNFTLSEANKTAVYEGSFDACTINQYTVTISKNEGISTIYYRNGTSGSWSSTTSSTSFQANYDSAVQWYATADTGYSTESGSSSSPNSFSVTTSGGSISPTASLNSYTIGLQSTTYGSWSGAATTAYHFDYIDISGNTVTCKIGGSTGETRWTRTLSANANDDQWTYSASITTSSFGVVDAATIETSSDRSENTYDVTFTDGTYGSWSTASITAAYSASISRNGDTVTVGSQTATYSDYTATGYTTTVSYSGASGTVGTGAAVTATTTRTVNTYPVTISADYCKAVYLSTDSEATSGDASGSYFDYGSTVYGFVELNDNDDQYRYTAPDDAGWVCIAHSRKYRVGAITVDTSGNSFSVAATRSLQKYAVWAAGYNTATVKGIYFSTDQNALSGETSEGTRIWDYGSTVYLFTELADNTEQYLYTPKSHWVQIGNSRHYRIASLVVVKAIAPTDLNHFTEYVEAVQTLRTYYVRFIAEDGVFSYSGDTDANGYLYNVPYGSSISGAGGLFVVADPDNSVMGGASYDKPSTTVDTTVDSSPTYTYPTTVTGNTEVRATCNSRTRYYTVNWMPYTGSTPLETDTNVQYNDILSYDGLITPTRDATYQYTYTHSGWHMSSAYGDYDVTNGITRCKGSTLYTTLEIRPTFTPVTRRYTVTQSGTWTLTNVDRYVSTSSMAATGSSSITVDYSTTVYAFAKLHCPIGTVPSDWILIYGSAASPGAVYRIGSTHVISDETATITPSEAKVGGGVSGIAGVTFYRYINSGGTWVNTTSTVQGAKFDNVSNGSAGGGYYYNILKREINDNTSYSQQWKRRIRYSLEQNTNLYPYTATRTLYYDYTYAGTKFTEPTIYVYGINQNGTMTNILWLTSADQAGSVRDSNSYLGYVIVCKLNEEEETS